MKIEKNKDFYFVTDEEGKNIGGGKTPLEAACNAAEYYCSPGSTFWYRTVAEIITNTPNSVLNHWKNPFNL
jgi:hypothetical protein